MTRVRSSLVARLTAMRRRLARLEAEQARTLAALPARFGFANAQEFCLAVEAAIGRPRQRPSRRRRAVITKATRAAVKNMVQNGKTAKEIQELLGLSASSIYNIKRLLRVSRPR